MYESRRPVTELIEKRLKKKASKITYSNTFVCGDLKLTIINRRDWGSYTPALLAIHNQLSSILSHHCKVLVIRFDLRMQEANYFSKQLSDFFRAFIRKVKNFHKLKRLAYGWGRELKTAKAPHFQCFIAVDGNTIQNGT